MAFQTQVALGEAPSNIEWLAHLTPVETVEAYEDVRRFATVTWDFDDFVRDFRRYCRAFPGPDALAKCDALIDRVTADMDMFMQKKSIADQTAGICLEALERSIRGQQESGVLAAEII